MPLVPMIPPGSVNQVWFGPTQNWQATVTYESWVKPRSANWIWMFACSAGGGGGNGFAASAGSAKGGGGGGGGGASMQLFAPAMFWPERLYFSVGMGTSAGNGDYTLVSVGPTTTTQGQIASLPGGVKGANGAGTGNAAGGGGQTGTFYPQSRGFQISTATGGNGVTGGQNSAGTNVTGSSSTAWNLGGAGGAGSTASDTAGGSVLTSFNAADYTHGFASNAGGAAGSNPGAQGRLLLPVQGAPSLMGWGGSGGGASNSTTGGAGGNGAPGCGGGGGGGGVGSGGAGGKGGDGFVMIVWG